MQPPIPAFAFAQDLLEEWKGKGGQVEEIGRRGTLLENLIVEITAPDTPSKAGESQPSPLEDASFLRTLLSLMHLLKQKMRLFPPFNQLHRAHGGPRIVGISPMVESLPLTALVHQPCAWGPPTWLNLL